MTEDHQTDAPARKRLTLSPADAVCFALSLVLMAGLAIAANSIVNGRLPLDDVFNQADAERVFGNLTGASDSYYRLKVHPLYGWVCILFQHGLIGALHLSRASALALTTSGATLAGVGLMYAVMRRFEIAPYRALGFTALYAASGASVAWCCVPDTHVFGGVSVLLTVLIVRPPGGAEPSSLRRAFGFVASFSMVVTNAALWILEQVEFERLAIDRLAALVSHHWALARQRLPALLIGIALLFVLWGLQWPLLHKRLGIPFNFLEEHNYVQVSARSPLFALNTLGYVMPGPVSGPIGLVAIVLTAATLRALPRRYWFLPLFALFGVALHMVYGSESAFLFSANYAPASVVALALAAERVALRWGWVAAAVVAPCLAVLNLHDLQQAFAELAATGRLIKL